MPTMDQYAAHFADELAVARARVAKLEAALDLCMVGGNHLPIIFGVNHPHAGVNPDVARKYFGYGDKYEAWCCWDAIMRARDIRESA